MYKHILKLSLALLFTVFSSQEFLVNAQNKLAGQGQNTHSTITEGTTASTGAHHLFLSAFSPTDGEPLLLLLFGLVVFLGATTVKRRNTDLR